jgi:hypothetical protein
VATAATAASAGNDAAAITAVGAGNAAGNAADAGIGAGAGTTAAGANADAAGAATIEDEQVPLAVNDEDDFADDAEVIAPENTNTANDTGIVGIEDEETPLAASTVAETHRKWYWWILLIIAAITGKTGYDKKHKKNLFAEKDKA